MRAAVPVRNFLHSDAGRLFLTSLLILYLELIAIRWLSSELRIFAFLKNIPLVVSFLGLGLGIMAQRPRLSIKPILLHLLVLLVLLLASASFIGISQIPIPSGDDIWIWWSSESAYAGPLRASPALFLFTIFAYGAAVILFLLLLFSIFFGLGELLRERLKPFVPLRAYSIDLVGSICGVGLFTLFSFLQLSPLWWFAVGFAVFFLLIPPRPSSLLLAGLALLTIAIGTHGTYWSPYYRIKVTDYRAGNPRGPSALALSVNHVYFQAMMDLSPESLAANPQSFLPNSAVNYNLPYQFIENPGKVLIVGAGSGNDVAAALRRGATSVDAVEIDPAIIRLGAALHPEAPYGDPRVRVIVDDARSFFEKTGERYDTIVYGILDSHTSVSAFSNVRLDNFVYTKESFAAARNHLADGGSVVVSFAAGKPWILARLASMLSETFGREPLAFHRSSGAEGGIFILGENLNMSALESPDVRELRTDPPDIPSLRIPTDDWPYLYLKKPGIPALYLGTLALVGVLFFLVAYKFLGRGAFSPLLSRRSEHWHFFFLGAAFLLIETKSVNELALLFGSTWVVNSSVIFGILAMAFLANRVIQKGLKIPLALIVAGLFGSLALGYFVRIGTFSGEPFLVKFVLVGLLVALPLFFSGLLFSRSFQHTSQIAEAFGANLFGAFLGGMIENSAMITGMHALAFFAAFFYAVAVVLRPKRSTLPFLE